MQKATNKLSNNADKLINAKVELSHRPSKDENQRCATWSPVRQSGEGKLPHACWLESPSNLTNPGLGETRETDRRNHLTVLPASSQ